MTEFKLVFVVIALFIGFLIPIPGLNYLDESIALISLFYLFFNYRRLIPEERKIVLCLLFLLVAGIIGTEQNKYQTNIIPIMLDILSCSKFFLVFIASRHYVLTLSDDVKKRTIKTINIFIIPFVVIGAFCGIVNFFTDIGMSYEHRLGFRTFKFIFSDSGHIGMCWHTVMLFLTANYMLSPKRKNLIIVIMGLIVWVLTFKSRAILFVLLYAMAFYWMIIKNRSIKVNVFTILILVAFSVFITLDQMERYFLEGNEAMPRTILMNGGINTMIRFFPFGAGFGTYGTDVAAKYYSNLYYELGYDTMWGLTPDEPFYAHDNYWPAIMGEFGAIGVLLELIIFYYIYKLMRLDFSTSKVAQFYSLFGLITLLFASLPTSVFFQSNTLYFFLLLPLISINLENEYE